MSGQLSVARDRFACPLRKGPRTTATRDILTAEPCDGLGVLLLVHILTCTERIFAAVCARGSFGESCNAATAAHWMAALGRSRWHHYDRLKPARCGAEGSFEPRLEGNRGAADAFERPERSLVLGGDGRAYRKLNLQAGCFD